ncbi:ribonuclease P [Halobacteriales archaeon QS_3_64_16]|nr:MAG: ribonuclease P [Halobacteriales archaeon QS_3_64_16]
MSARSSSLSPTPTPETLSRHELNGLSVRVAEAANPDAVGIAGRVVGETQNTLVIEETDGTEQRVPKGSATFEFALPASEGNRGSETDGEQEADSAARTYVTVEGARIAANPARRTERKRRSKWR